jgi:phosphoserine/homoserine phosphotransferase
VAKKTGIEELKLTTRDISDYDVLMKRRLAILDEKGLKLKDITDVIATMDPLPGAKDFMDWIRSVSQLIVVSDTFIQFGAPLMKKLGLPTLFCHELVVDDNGYIKDYRLRQADAKRKTVLGLKSMNYRVIAFGDSYNDVNMLKEADTGFLFCPPQNVIDEFPQFPVTRTYDELRILIEKAL